MIIWSSKFKILRDNFQLLPVSRVLSSDMDIGPAKKRRRTVMKLMNVSFSMYMKQDVFDEFMDFYYDNDATVFYFPRPDTKTTVSARFTTAPTATFNETLWQVSVQLEFLP